MAIITQKKYHFLRPEGNSVKDLFIYCVKYVIEKNLFSESYNHIQWANIIFGYEKNSSMRTSFMSKVKREYTIYFTHTNKYSFIEDKIKRDFPSLFGIEVDDSDGEYTCEDLVRENIKAISNEIIEERNPNNVEYYKGEDLDILRTTTRTYIYHVKLLLSDGQEPHFHEGIPFKLKVYRKRFLCEAVDFDYESGQLFFTSNRKIIPASNCSIQLDSVFILEGLKERLKMIESIGVDEDLPYSKFFFDDTCELNNVAHKRVPVKYKKHLDDSQRSAFDAAIDKDLTFIWGPPGTGKSFTLASIIYALYKFGVERTAVCCLSNVAVDQLLCKFLDLIDKDGLEIESGNIYRAGRTKDSRVIDTDYLFPNDKTTNKLRSNIKRNSEKIDQLKARKRDMTEKAIALKAENREYREELKNRTEFLVTNSRIVFSTISNFILSKNLSDSKFENLIVDEASMLAMPSLIALGSKITKRLIFVGDFQQLSPIANSKNELLTDSVFELAGINMENTSHPALYQLLNQRRSNKKIVDLINKTYYDGRLIPALKEKTKVTESDPYNGKVIVLKDVPDGAVRFTKGGTRQNKIFAENVMDLLDEFYNQGADYSIGIITPYKGQAALLRALKIERGYSNDFDQLIKIGTIHTFQGSECDVIIYDMVDCALLENGNKSRIGKIYSGSEGERLLNVAVSRARYKLIVVCDSKYISNIPGNTITYRTHKIFTLLSKCYRG